MAIPVGINSVRPGSSTSGAVRHARRSTPAEPEVAYWGSGNSRPTRSSRILIFRRRCATADSDMRPLLGGTRGPLPIAFGNELDQSARHLELRSALQFLAAARP